MLLQLFLLLPALAQVSLASTNRPKDHIYRRFSIDGYCFRRTNGTHQFGCSSHLNGNVGVVQLIRNREDVDVVVSSGEHPPYMAVFTTDMFNREVLVQMRESGRIAGAVLLQNDSLVEQPPVGQSDDSSCPNQYSSLYFQEGESDSVCSTEDNPWNQYGTDLLHEDFPFPIFYTKDTEFLVNDCYMKHNQPGMTWPLCAVELKSHMYSAGDTETCLRRSDRVSSLLPTRFCDEMGDYTTYWFVEAKNSSIEEDANQDDSVILVSAQVDGFSLFDGKEFGAGMPTTSFVTWLEVARLINQNKPKFRGQVKNILFALFNGEAFDYLGSSSFAHQLSKGEFPLANTTENRELYPHGFHPVLNASHLHSMVEIGQIFNENSGGRLFVHTDTEYSDDQSLITRMTRLAGDNNLVMRGSTAEGLPPSSAQSVLKIRRDLPAIMINDFDVSYSNRYFHSVYDLQDNIGYNSTDGVDQGVVDHIARTAQTIAEYLYELASDDNRRNVVLPDFEPDREGINDLLTCYIETADCDMFKAVSNSDMPPYVSNFPSYPYPQYVGVDWKKTYHALFTKSLLGLYTATEVGNITKEEDCKAPTDQNIYSYSFMKSLDPPAASWSGDEPCNATGACGRCFNVTLFSSLGLSPAFTEDDYDFSSGKYPTWAESVWKTVDARIFLKGNPALDAGFFAVGIIVFFLSLLVVLMAERSAKDVFMPDAPIAEVTAAAAGSGSNATMVTTATAGENLPQPAAL